ncbi:MAG: SpoIVB peptidase [Clostridia bacterium]|nr:SpoIVB peptidase [Clostridia bacterium]
MQNKKVKNAFRIIFIICIISIATIGIYDFIIPDTISVFSNITDKEITREISVPFVSADIESVPISERVSQSKAEDRLYSLLSANTKIFGVLPLKKVNVDVFREITLYPGGMPFGVRLYTDGVIVAGVSGVETANGKKTPAVNAGIKVGDIIKKIGENEVNTTDEICTAIEQSGGKKIAFTVVRANKELNIEIEPALSETDKMYRAGMWLRDSTAGIGTVTFISPNNNGFAGLGHGICDVDTGIVMPLRKGTVVDVSIKGITKGVTGTPGELKGVFLPGRTGSLIGNKTCGVYGIMSEKIDLSHSEPLKIGLKDDVEIGDAEIYCTISKDVEKYTAKIVKIGNKEGEQKNFVIKITDKRLLEATGGIVQGMSGSPIIQNGKLVGAITHVLVNDPTKGYGIFIENMLKNMPEIME